MSKNVTNVCKKKQKGNIDLFAERLKATRIKAGFSTQETLAKEANISRGAISFYEKSDRLPDINFFISIADTLNVSYDYLLGYSDSPIREYHDTKEITGLSDKAIEVLNNLVKETKHTIGSPEIAINKIKTINYLLEQEENFDFLNKISDFLWSEYKTEYAEGLDVVKTEDILGNTHLFSLTDLKNINILEIEILLNKLKENIETKNIVKDNKKKK